MLLFGLVPAGIGYVLATSARRERSESIDDSRLQFFPFLILSTRFLSCALAVLIAGGTISSNRYARYHARYERSSRARSDMRTLATALESYAVDHGAYPAWSVDPAVNAFAGLERPPHYFRNIPTFRLNSDAPGLHTLTTPTAYVPMYPGDRFAPVKDAPFAYRASPDPAGSPGWILWSPGPDGDYDITLDNVAALYNPAERVPSDALIGLSYDPTNGNPSDGDVFRVKQ